MPCFVMGEDNTPMQKSLIDALLKDNINYKSNGNDMIEEIKEEVSNTIQESVINHTELRHDVVESIVHDNIESNAESFMSPPHQKKLRFRIKES